VLPLYPVTLAGLALAGVVEGTWPWQGALIGLAAWVALIGGLWLLSGGRGMGFGDVKLSPVLGATLGWVSVASALTGLLAAFVLGAVIGIGILLAHRGRSRVPAPATGSSPDPDHRAEAPAGTPIAFGPFLLAGAAVGLLFGDALASAYLSVVGWT